MEKISHNSILENKRSLGRKLLYTVLILFVVGIIDELLARLLDKSLLYYTIILPGYLLAGWWIYRYVWKNSTNEPKLRTKADDKAALKAIKSIALNILGAVEIPNPYTGVLIIGGAGSGKSKSIVEPIIYEAARLDYALVCYDFKFPTLAKYVANAYSNSARVKQYYVNFTELNLSHTVNPVSPKIMINGSFAREFANAILANINPQSISKPDFWSDNAQTFLASVLWFLREERPEYCTLPHAMAMILGSDTERLINLLKSNAQSKDMIQPIATAYDAGSANQIAGVVSSLQVSISKINSPEAYWVLGDSNADCDLDINNIERPAALTIGNDPVLSSTYGPLIGLILTATSKMLNRQGKHKSIFLIDEFPTLYLPNVEQFPATARSNKVATILAAQDITQMIDKYGKQKADTILSNLGNQFYGRTSSPDTALRVSKLFGKEEKLMKSNSENYGRGLLKLKKGTSNSYSFQERDIVKPQDVTTLDTGSFYVSLSEGAVKQGKIAVKASNIDFEPNSLTIIRNVTDEQVKAKFLKIRMEVEAIINGLL